MLEGNRDFGNQRQFITTAPTATTPASKSAYRLRQGDASIGLAGSSVSLAAFLIYLATIAPDLTWANAGADGGELITASYSFGIPHPPGYPTYVLLGRLFSFLPFGNIAFRYNLFSAVCTALAAGLLTTLVLRLGSDRSRSSLFVAAAAGLSFALLPLVWSQAIVAEVYGLNLLLLAAFLLALAGGKRAGLAGFFLGLAITGHLTSLLFVPLGFIISPARSRGRFAAGMLAGILPLLVLPVLAQGDSPVVWGKPTDLAGWWWLVSGRLYHDGLWRGIEISRIAGASRAWAPHLIWIIAPLLLAAPLLATANPQQNGLSQDRRRLLLALGAIPLLYTFAALAYDTADAFVNLLPAMFLAIVVAAPALRPLGPLAMLLPLGLLVGNFHNQDLSADRQARAAAETLLAQAPEGAVLLTPGDRTIFTLWYFQEVEGMRPDVILVDENLFAFDWYREQLQTRHPDLPATDRDDLIRFQTLNQRYRPVCAGGLGNLAAVLPASQTGRSPDPALAGVAQLHCQRELP